MAYLSKPDQDEKNFIACRGEWDIWIALGRDKDLKRRAEGFKRGLSGIYQKDSYFGAVKIQGL